MARVGFPCPDEAHRFQGSLNLSSRDHSRSPRRVRLLSRGFGKRSGPPFRRNSGLGLHLTVRPPGNFRKGKPDNPTAEPRCANIPPGVVFRSPAPTWGGVEFDAPAQKIISLNKAKKYRGAIAGKRRPNLGGKRAAAHFQVWFTKRGQSFRRGDDEKTGHDNRNLFFNDPIG